MAMTNKAVPKPADDDPAPLKVFVLRPCDPQEPPFHFTGVPAVIVVAAASEKDARRHVAAYFGEPNGAAWGNPKMAECDELMPTKTGIIAKDMG